MLKLLFTVQIFIWMCFFITSKTLGFDYCSISCKHEDVTIKQIICERDYKCSLPAYGCIKFQNATLSPEEKSLILDEHNRLRNIVALGETSFALKHITGADMNELLWDNELETIALCWVNTCGLYENDLDSVCLDTENAESGYNVAFKRISVLSKELKSIQTLEEHINGWFSEVEGFSEESVDKYPADILQRKLKRFSQLAWAETTHVGCARSMYGQYITMFACIYSPAGNIDDRTVFIKGPPCSKCKYGTCSKKYEGLCKVTKSKTKRSTVATATSTIITPSTAILTNTTTVTNPANITTTTEEIQKHRMNQSSTSSKSETTLTTKAAAFKYVWPVTFAKNLKTTTVKNSDSSKNKTKKPVLESRHAAQTVVANTVGRNDKKFVKDFGLFVVGMVIILK
ncbi:hypothetical protein ILUMI_13876 [Ignelater luminosus]|uniref:SCP domain-containing protein n=1 Tax=Ignelater luminosus TaxID=2038154 RepID=A0A8K0CTK2_IGNLU|nr:hypothetical protein ILUMI_13876 [Ignelater luminosus]